MNISQAHEISIISFLEKEGFRPCRVYGDNYWYRSPLREEKIASFKVNREIHRNPSKTEREMVFFRGFR